METCERFFAVGSAIYDQLHPAAEQLVESTAWLIQQRNNDGTWGGEDELDKFITTIHTAMTLLSVGFSPSSDLVRAAINYLITIDTDIHVNFFYRSGVLLNLPQHRSIVAEDIEYLWKYRRRIGVHKDYPTMYFLLKLIKFSNPSPQLTFTKREVVKWVIEDWNENECWYGRTSLTSMALALIYDERFGSKKHIVNTSRTFLESKFVSEADGRGYFDPNIVDDGFTIYNLCERRGFLNRAENLGLRETVSKAVNRLLYEVREGLYWESPPPFGGSVGSVIYPTAVTIRAILSFFVREVPLFAQQLSTALLDKRISDFHSPEHGYALIKPFWGEFTLRSDSEFCFVLMPFASDLTEIYKKHIKQPIESSFKLQCIRADDFFRSSPVMPEIWHNIAEARFIIAEMTGKNANVFYELGLAHTLGKRVILISQSKEDNPFDLKSVRTIIYDDNESGYSSLETKILKFVEEILKEDSPQDVI